MPEFDVESVSRTNKLDKVKLDILNRRQSTIDAYEQYQKYLNLGHRQKGLSDFKIKLGSLFVETKQMLEKEIKNDTEKIYQNTEQIKADIESTDVERVMKAFDYIESLLYQKRITQIDTRETVDTSDILAMNKKNYY